MINRTVLTGRLTRDAELKTTQSGLSVAAFTLAVNRQFTDKNGNRGADFINCVIWKKGAENLCKFTNKGSLIGVDGRIQTRSYDDKNGQRVYVTEVVVDSFALLESKKDREANNSNGNFNNQGSNYNNQATNNNNTSGFDNNKSQDPFNGAGDTVDITDDDLPF